MQRFLLSAALAVVPFVAVELSAQTLPNNFVNETLVSAGLTAPHDFCFLPDGRVLIANRPGSVSLWTGTSTVTSQSSRIAPPSKPTRPSAVPPCSLA